MLADICIYALFSFLLGIKQDGCFIWTQNHKVGETKEHRWGSLNPATFSEHGCLQQAAQGHGQMGFEHLWRERLSQCSPTFNVGTRFLSSNEISHISPCAHSLLSLGTTEHGLALLPLLPPWGIYALNRLHGLLLHWLQYFCVYPILGSRELDPAQQMSHQEWIWEGSPPSACCHLSC